MRRKQQQRIRGQHSGYAIRAEQYNVPIYICCISAFIVGETLVETTNLFLHTLGHDSELQNSAKSSIT
jgi:hypothetical protein